MMLPADVTMSYALSNYTLTPSCSLLIPQPSSVCAFSSTPISSSLMAITYGARIPQEDTNLCSSRLTDFAYYEKHMITSDTEVSTLLGVPSRTASDGHLSTKTLRGTSKPAIHANSVLSRKSSYLRRSQSQPRFFAKCILTACTC
jgi:hypothetical protein